MRVGERITFVVTNEGTLVHEFYIGDAAAQDAHEAELVAADLDVPRDSASGIAVDAGRVEEITYVFPAPGAWIVGCHVRNHYSGGMRSTITVVE